MIPFCLYSACSALENVHTKAWSKKEKTPKGELVLSSEATDSDFQGHCREPTCLTLNAAVCLMGVRTLFLGLGKAPSMSRSVHFGINTCRGPRHTDDPTQGKLSLVSLPGNPPSSEGLFLRLGHGTPGLPPGQKKAPVLLAGSKRPELWGKEVSRAWSPRGAVPVPLVAAGLHQPRASAFF